MVSTASILACIVTLFVSLILPIVIFIVYAVKNKNCGIVSAWFLGAAGFFVTQILIRLPILNVLSLQDWFLRFSQEHIFLYTLSLAFTAGLFELAGRYAVAKIMEKKLTYRRSLAAGLGHGGIEAIMIVGMTYVNNLVLIVMINSGAYEALIAQTAAMGVDVSQLQLVQTQLIETSPVLFLMGGAERVLTMICHAAMSMLVCYGVAHKRTVPYILACLGIHIFIDTCSGISLLATPQGGSVLSQTTAYAIIYVILAAVAVVSLLILKGIRRRWQEQSANGGIL